jgi:undecaprenyl-diphosphatase
MNLFQAVILGVIQGLTEFLPISSSGHLVVLPNIFGWAPHPLVFDTTLHLGTAAALGIFFFKDLWNIFVSFFKDVWNHEENFKKYSDDGKMGLYILLGSIPAGLLGLMFEDVFETVFRNVSWVILFLLLGSILMSVAEKLKLWERKKSKGLNYLKAFVIGIFQSLALFPGLSRSGATISGGMLFGLDREKAARFSFLLSVPIVVAAGLYKFYESKAMFLDPTVSLHIEPMFLIAGFISSFLVGLGAIKFLLNFLKKNSLWVFVVYRAILILVLVFFLMY